jgi:dihydrofolate reductase
VTAISLVVAVAENGVIGNGGKIPWRIAGDMRHFKSVTLGKPCIMGRKTWDSLPNKPLPGRTNIVVTRDSSFEAPGTVVVHSLDEAVLRAEAEHAPEIAVIGGAALYTAAFSRATRIHLTEVHRAFAGDTWFIFYREGWRETARESHATEEGLHYSFVTFERAATPR